MLIILGYRMSGRLGGWLDMAWGCIGALEFGHTVEKLENNSTAFLHIFC